MTEKQMQEFCQIYYIGMVKVIDSLKDKTDEKVKNTVNNCVAIFEKAFSGKKKGKMNKMFGATVQESIKRSRGNGKTREKTEH